MSKLAEDFGYFGNFALLSEYGSNHNKTIVLGLEFAFELRRKLNIAQSAVIITFELIKAALIFFEKALPCSSLPAKLELKALNRSKGEEHCCYFYELELHEIYLCSNEGNSHTELATDERKLKIVRRTKTTGQFHFELIADCQSIAIGERRAQIDSILRCLHPSRNLHKHPQVLSYFHF